MTVFVRDKRDGHISRYALMGNINIGADFITLVKDPRISTTMVKLRTAQYEVFRVTEEQLETPESVESWVSEEPYGARNIANYIERVFREV